LFDAREVPERSSFKPARNRSVASEIRRAPNGAIAIDPVHSTGGMAMPLMPGGRRHLKPSGRPGNRETQPLAGPRSARTDCEMARREEYLRETRHPVLCAALSRRRIRPPISLFLAGGKSFFHFWGALSHIAPGL
jgi:hypothetical protein